VEVLTCISSQLTQIGYSWAVLAELYPI